MLDKYQEAAWIREVKAKQKRGELLSQEEIRLLEGHEALQNLKNAGLNKGAYVRVYCTKGMIEGTLAGQDEMGNMLIEYARSKYAVLEPQDVSRTYKLRESQLVDLEQYEIGDGLYARIVSKEGVIKKFFDARLERKRVKGEPVELPEEERIRPGDDWGMKVQ